VLQNFPDEPYLVVVMANGGNTYATVELAIAREGMNRVNVL
jgi:hypothetical protein